jgi:hypothetical protein
MQIGKIYRAKYKTSVLPIKENSTGNVLYRWDSIAKEPLLLVKIKEIRNAFFKPFNGKYSFLFLSGKCLYRSLMPIDKSDFSENFEPWTNETKTASS